MLLCSMDPRQFLLRKRPRTKAELQSYLGLINYYRKWIPNFVELTRPLVELKNRKVNDLEKVWTPEHEQAFQELLTRLIPMLSSKL